MVVTGPFLPALLPLSLPPLPHPLPPLSLPLPPILSPGAAGVWDTGGTFIGRANRNYQIVTGGGSFQDYCR